MRITRKRAVMAAGLIVVSTMALTSCAASSATTPTSTAAAAVGSVDLSGICPATVVIQTDWNPESEHGHLYELLGSDYTIDSGNKSVSGPLLAGGQPTGVNVEIRAGGPAIGFSTVSSQMYTDKSITLGYVNTDASIQLSKDLPTTAVFAPLDKNPQMIMWDPSVYPNVKTIADLKATGAVVRYFGDSAWMNYFTQQGILSAEQVDSSYDGTPANFIAAAGKDAQQGFASAEPYVYENEISAWGKPVAYQLIDDAGWKTYQSSISVRTDELAGLSDCLTKLVPVMQQAEVDFMASPAAAQKLILALVAAYDNGWVYSQGVADYSQKTMAADKLVSNGANSTIGDFDADRMSKVFADSVPLFTGLGSAPAEGLTVDDIYTNKFIDMSIGLK
jgi:hypothetical protein